MLINQKMKSVLLILVTVSFFTNLSFSQKIGSIEFDTIKKYTNDSLSSYYYPKLMDRFVKGDTTLYFNEYQYIYYGSVFSVKYKPYSGGDDEAKFLNYYRKRKYKKAILLGEKILEENAVNLAITFKMIVCYTAINDSEKAQLYADRYFPILDVIYNTGDGKSIKTAYVVCYVNDEYEIVADLELKSTQQKLIGYTDILTIDSKGQQEGTEISELYFNVSKPLEYTNHLME